MVSIGKCDCCQRDNVPIIATPETDVICIECHRLIRDNCDEAIKEIEEFLEEIENGK